MAKQRDKIRMSKEEIADFLDSSKSLMVATLDKQGAPHLTTLWFARSGDDILFETYGTSQKVVNLKRDPRIAVMCEQGETYNELRGVSIQGIAEVVDGGPRLEKLMTVILDRSFPGQTPEALSRLVANMMRKRVVVVVHPQRTISWDHRKLAAGHSSLG
jgi:PPOX class probable F420-dependent enzyme